MPLPAYARHMSPEQYERYQKQWHRFNSYYRKTDIQTPEDAAAFFMIAALDRVNDDGSRMPVPPSLYNDGRSIGSTAALVQYQPDLATAGLEIALTQYFDLNSHGLEALAYIAESITYYDNHKPEKWTKATIEKLLDLTLELDPETIFDPRGYEEEITENRIYTKTLKAAHRYTLRFPDENHTGFKEKIFNNVQHYISGINDVCPYDRALVTSLHITSVMFDEEEQEEIATALSQKIAKTLSTDELNELYSDLSPLSLETWLKPLVEQAQASNTPLQHPEP